MSATRREGEDPAHRMSITEWNRWTQRCVRIPLGIRAVEFSLVCRSGSYLVMHASLAWSTHARSTDERKVLVDGLAWISIRFADRRRPNSRSSFSASFLSVRAEPRCNDKSVAVDDSTLNARRSRKSLELTVGLPATMNFCDLIIIKTWRAPALLMNR